MAVSLDGFIATEEDGLDWLDHPGAAQEDHGYDAFIAAMDGIVMGRRTYETVLGFGHWPYRLPVIVLSAATERLAAPKGADVRRAAAPEKAWAQAAARGWKKVYVDGGATVRSYLDRGGIADITLTRVPALLGAGKPLFAPMARAPKLTHLDTRCFPSGLVQSRYAVA